MATASNVAGMDFKGAQCWQEPQARLGVVILGASLKLLSRALQGVEVTSGTALGCPCLRAEVVMIHKNKK